MASYLRPRRGKKATATSNNIVLKRGEVFFEVPDTGVGTGMGKIKMGDGTTAYGSLPYFNEAIDPSTITGIQNSITQLNNDLIGYGQGHNAIYRGKNLGTITSANLSTFLSDHGITNGTFTDLYLGDYFVIQDGTYNAEWMVAGFNTHMNKGSSNIVTANHIAIIPRTTLFNDKMNSEHVTTGGYKGSYMHTTVMATVTTKLNGVLGTHLLTRDALLSNTVDTTNKSSAYTAWTGASSNWEWVATRCELMTETEVYGAPIFSSSAYDQGEGCMKLPVFNFINHVQFARANFWLRSVTLSTLFCLANGSGGANGYDAGYSYGVRPLALLG